MSRIIIVIDVWHTLFQAISINLIHAYRNYNIFLINDRNVHYAIKSKYLHNQIDKRKKKRFIRYSLKKTSVAHETERRRRKKSSSKIAQVNIYVYTIWINRCVMAHVLSLTRLALLVSLLIERYAALLFAAAVAPPLLKAHIAVCALDQLSRSSLTL